MERPDLALYAARLGFQGSYTPTLETLRALHRLHPQAIPFENLTPLGGEAPALELPALESKLLRGRRGGWCFEHNLLLRAVLQECGFRVTALAARVLWGQAPQAETARSHMLLLVDVGGEPQLADVGFGGLTLTAPLRLVADVVQDTPHGPFVLRRQGAYYSLHALLPQGETALYRFDLTPQLPVDYAFANWYLATHPASVFVNTLRIARSVEAGRHALLNGDYHWRPLRGDVQQRQVQSVAALRVLLDEAFGIDLPASATTDARLAPLLHNVRR